MQHRIERLNELIKRELSKLIQKEIDFPDNVIVTVTRVETASNLNQSKVFVSVLPNARIDTVLRILVKSKYELQQLLNKRLLMRPTPLIVFKEEKRTAEAANIESILNKINTRD